jgi:hypothetical protein
MRMAAARSTAAIALAGVGLLAGCGSGSSGGIPKNADPRTEFLLALANSTHANVMTTTFKIDASADDLLTFAKDTSEVQADAPTPQEAQEIVDGSIIIETKSRNDKQISSAVPGFGPNLDNAVILDEKGQPYAEIRQVGSTVYLRADLKSLIALGTKPNIYDNLAAQVKNAPAFARDFVAGKFVSLDTATLRTLVAEIGGALGVQTPTAAQLNQFAATLKADISRDVTVTKQGSSGKSDHLVLTADSQTLVHDLLSAVASVEPQLATKIQADANSKKVQSKTVKLDAYVKDGKLTQISLDLTQFADPGQVPLSLHVPFTMTLSQSGDDIKAPSGATPVDVSQLFSLFAQLGGK